jgi:hypothetical protein
MLTKQNFIDACVDACNGGTFVTEKHDSTKLATTFGKKRSVNCMGNEEMASYLQAGDFKVFCYKDDDPKHSPEFYCLKPNDNAVVPGSGVPAYSTVPTTQCDVFAVPSGYEKGWHCYAYNESSVKHRESRSNDGLTFDYELM